MARDGGGGRKIEKVKEIERKTGKEKKMVLVKLKDRVRKREVMQRKNVLKGRKERIEDDMTLKERKMQWSLERIAEKERRRAWVKYGKIWIEAKWWSWVEWEK